MVAERDDIARPVKLRGLPLGTVRVKISGILDQKRGVEVWVNPGFA